MKVLHVLNHSLPQLDGYAIRSGNIVRFQVEMGLTPVVLTSAQQEPAAASEREVIDGILYYRTPRRALYPAPFLRQLHAVRRMAARIDDVVRTERPDVLHAHSPCLWGQAATRVARRHGLPLVYEIRGIWEDAAVDQGKTRPTSLRYRLSRAPETRVAGGANAIVTIAEHLKDELIQRGIPEERIFLVPNSPTNRETAGSTSSPPSSIDCPKARESGRRMRLTCQKIVSPNSDPALFTLFAAHNYRFAGVEICTASNNYNLVMMGYGLKRYHDPIYSRTAATSVAQLPYNIIFDRCYVHSTSAATWARTGILANGRYVAVIDSRISNFKDRSDAQAICVWFGAGPFKILNNYLEASGENIMFGGERIPIAHLVPADVEIRGNHFSKPFSWMYGNARFVHNWTVKNLFELKCAERVLVKENVFENNWAVIGQNSGGQRGTAIVLTVRNQYGDSPWAVVEDVDFTGNVIRHVGCGFRVTGEDDHYKSQQTKRIRIANNIVEDVNRLYFANSRGFGVSTPRNGAPVLSLVIRNNLLLHNGPGNAFLSLGDSTVVAERFVFENNIVTHADYGLFGCGRGSGNPALKHFASNWSFRRNAIVFREGDRGYSAGQSQTAGLGRGRICRLHAPGLQASQE